MQEIVIELAGPAVNLAIFAGLYAGLVVAGRQPWLEMADPFGGPLLASLMAVNLWLLLFNLVPASPMDGGRVLRALIATRLPYGRATRAAARVGQCLAMAGGLLGLFQQDVSLVLVAAFVFLAAG